MSQLMELGNSIEEQYEQGPSNDPTVTDMQVPQGQQQAMTPEQANQFLDENLPLMRKQGEYDRLMVEQLTNDAMLNRRPIAGIPGLLGLELKVRELEAKEKLATQYMRLEEMESHRKSEDEKLRNISIQSGVTGSLRYDGLNAGAILAVAKGEDPTTAPELQVPSEGNPDRRISFQEPGGRSISLIPGMWMIKCSDGTAWSITDTDYNTIKTQGPTNTQPVTPTI